MWCTYRQCSEYTATFTTGFQRQLVNLNYIRKKCYNSTQKLTFGDQLKVGDWSEKKLAVKQESYVQLYTVRINESSVNHV